MPSPKKKPALGKFLGAPVVGVRDQASPRKAMSNGKKQPVALVKAPRAAEGGKMQTVYLRDGDLPKVWKAENALKVSRAVPGRIGLSLLLRVGLDWIDEELERNPDAVLARAARVAGAEEE
jgi:hypothetical protein